jgi:hypothetical protein
MLNKDLQAYQMSTTISEDDATIEITYDEFNRPIQPAAIQQGVAMSEDNNSATEDDNSATIDENDINGNQPPVNQPVVNQVVELPVRDLVKDKMQNSPLNKIKGLVPLFSIPYSRLFHLSEAELNNALESVREIDKKYDRPQTFEEKILNAQHGINNNNRREQKNIIINTVDNVFTQRGYVNYQPRLNNGNGFIQNLYALLIKLNHDGVIQVRDQTVLDCLNFNHENFLLKYLKFHYYICLKLRQKYNGYIIDGLYQEGEKLNHYINLVKEIMGGNVEIHKFVSSRGTINISRDQSHDGINLFVWGSNIFYIYRINNANWIFCDTYGYNNVLNMAINRGTPTKLYGKLTSYDMPDPILHSLWASYPIVLNVPENDSLADTFDLIIDGTFDMTSMYRGGFLFNLNIFAIFVIIIIVVGIIVGIIVMVNKYKDGSV